MKYFLQIFIISNNLIVDIDTYFLKENFWNLKKIWLDNCCIQTLGINY
jgi:hypothetical protein